MIRNDLFSEEDKQVECAFLSFKEQLEGLSDLGIIVEHDGTLVELYQ